MPLVDLRDPFHCVIDKLRIESEEMKKKDCIESYCINWQGQTYSLSGRA